MCTSERLPPERDLAKHYGTSRSTVREALRRLEELKLVTRRIGSGTYVSHREITDQQEIASITSPTEMVEVRIAIEERASLSPDALTGMEANLRFAGPETMETKIFGRLSAWQNWIFQRPNAVGPAGALTVYGKPERPRFDWTRT